MTKPMGSEFIPLHIFLEHTTGKLQIGRKRKKNKMEQVATRENLNTH
jgi:hypothetical protein